MLHLILTLAFTGSSSAEPVKPIESQFEMLGTWKDLVGAPSLNLGTARNQTAEGANARLTWIRFLCEKGIPFNRPDKAPGALPYGEKFGICFPPPCLLIWSSRSFDGYYHVRVEVQGHIPFRETFVRKSKSLKEVERSIWVRDCFTKSPKLWKVVTKRFVSQFVRDWKRSHDSGSQLAEEKVSIEAGNSGRY